MSEDKKRSRVTRGEVETMLSDMRMEIVGALEEYRKQAILPVLQLAMRRAAAYQPWWVRAWNWVRWRLLVRKGGR